MVTLTGTPAAALYFWETLAAAVAVLAVGTTLATLILWRNRKTDNRAPLVCRRALRNELAAVYEYCISIFGDRVSDLETIIAWYEKNDTIVEILTRLPGNAQVSDIEGYFCVLPLTDDGRHGIAKGTWEGAVLPPEVIASDKDARAVYIGGVAGRNSASQLKIMHRLLARLADFPDAIVFYTRPVTDAGLQWTVKSQFKRVDGQHYNEVGYLYKKDVLLAAERTKKAIRQNIRPGSGPRPRATRLFQACYGVFQGGGCRAAAYVGAYAEAVARGVRFIELAGTSAGSIVAVLIAAGATPLQLRQIIAKLDFSDLLDHPVATQKTMNFVARTILQLLGIIPFRLPRLLATAVLKNGLHSTKKLQDWLEAELKTLLPEVPPEQNVRFEHLHLPATVVATDLRERKVVIWSSNTTRTEEVAEAVCASCSIPFFFQPVKNRYVDGGTLSNLPSFVFSSRDRQRRFDVPILAFMLKAEFEQTEMFRSLGLITALANAIVDGSQDLQQKMQENVHLIAIDTGAIKATDFELMSPEKVSRLLRNGQFAARRFLEAEIDKFTAKRPLRVDAWTEQELWAILAERLIHARQSAVIALDDLEWFDEIDGALLRARLNGVEITLASNGVASSKENTRRRQVLEGLGCRMTPTEAKVSGCLFDSAEPQNSFALLTSTEKHSARGVLYSGRTDSAAMTCISTTLGHPASAKLKAFLRACTQAEIESLKNRLRNVSQYERDEIRIRVDKVPLAHLTSLTRYVQEHRYKQACSLADYYQRNGLSLYDPTLFEGDQKMEILIMPPVVEHDENTDKYYIIGGIARALVCSHYNLSSVVCLIVGGVQHPLPSSGRFRLDQVQIVSAPLQLAERFPDFDSQSYRLLPHPLLHGAREATGQHD